ncbi:GlyGly-CTERM sorting domain-containing protein [Candidatus Thorarchaeota archaeon]|nr:MAG: GlyGly-CTERM sorting domain-containing protein [Candidatus Thorarchaeota archaeon]
MPTRPLNFLSLMIGMLCFLRRKKRVS